jgi:hypothetical protein
VGAGLSASESRAEVAVGEKRQREFPSLREAWFAGDLSEDVGGEITIEIRWSAAQGAPAVCSPLNAQCLLHAEAMNASGNLGLMMAPTTCWIPASCRGSIRRGVPESVLERTTA